MEDSPHLKCRRKLDRRSMRQIPNRKSDRVDPRNKWMKNSFISYDQNLKENGADEDLNESDLALAEIDIEIFRGQSDANNHLGSPQSKNYPLAKKSRHKSQVPNIKQFSVETAPSDYKNQCEKNDLTKNSVLEKENVFKFIDKDEKSEDDLFCESDSESEAPDLLQNLKQKVLSVKKSVNLSKESHMNVEDVPCEKGDSLKEKLKKRLQQNIFVRSPKVDYESEIRNAAIKQAHLEASQIRKTGTGVDIGPFYGLPTKVQQLFESTRGISKLYDWQDECLSLEAVKSHKNLIYSLPTSGGKTLVAEILIMRELLCHERDAMLVLPFISIVQEKVQSISQFASELGFLVEEYAGSKGRFPPIKRRHKKSLYICTIEKAHSLINSLLESQRLDKLGLMIVDELHMLGEGGSRGATLESSILKVLHSQTSTQIIGMSATLNNVCDLKEFLSADLYQNDFRPVKLVEYIKVEENIFKVNNPLSENIVEHSRVALFPYSGEILKQDPDQILGLVTEVIPDNSCLVFCPNKKNCENLAMLLSRLLCKYMRGMSKVKRDERKQLLQELYSDGNGVVCPVLQYTVHFGIAYHHSGLTMDERRLIEDAYASGTLCLLTCTSTLAAGVNLPAKRVILRSPYVGMSFIQHSQYKQMCGRAGRAGIDSTGESILLVKKEDKTKVKDLLSCPKDFCHSSLMYDDGRGIRSLLLSAVGLQTVTSISSANDFIKRSLLHIQSGFLNVNTEEVTLQAVDFLVEKGLVMKSKRQPDNESIIPELDVTLEATRLGKATFKGPIDHQYSQKLYADLKRAEECLVLSTFLHLLYLVTPYDAAHTFAPDWRIYYAKYCNLSEQEIKVASSIGVPENYLSRKAAGMSTRQKVDPLSVNRFYLTLILWEIWNKKRVWDVAEAFQQTRGFVQNLLTQSASFASCVSRFCQELDEFWAYQDLLGNFVKRLSYCVATELIPLMEVPGVKQARARMLYEAGVTSLSLLAEADPENLPKIVKYLSKKAASQIIASAKNMLEEKRAILLEEMDALSTANISSQTKQLSDAGGNK